MHVDDYTLHPPCYRPHQDAKSKKDDDTLISLCTLAALRPFAPGRKRPASGSAGSRTPAPSSPKSLAAAAEIAAAESRVCEFLLFCLLFLGLNPGCTVTCSCFLFLGDVLV